MRTDWIEDIVALLDARGVADAAERRAVTQPAFSRRLHALEAVLGVTLVDRSVRPSGPSRLLLDNADRVRRLADDQRALLAGLREAEARGTPQIVVVCQHAITTSFGASIVAALRRVTGAGVRLRSANRDACETLLYAREAAFSVTYRVDADHTAPTPRILQEVILGAEPLTPVVRADAAGAVLRDYRAGRLTVIGYPPDVFLGATLARHVTPALARHCAVVVAAETALTPAAMQMARAGLGVAWVPHALARDAIDAGTLADLSDDLGAVTMRLVARGWRDEGDPSVRSAWAALCAGFRPTGVGRDGPLGG